MDLTVMAMSVVELASRILFSCICPCSFRPLSSHRYSINYYTISSPTWCIYWPPSQISKPSPSGHSQYNVQLLTYVLISSSATLGFWTCFWLPMLIHKPFLPIQPFYKTFPSTLILFCDCIGFLRRLST